MPGPRARLPRLLLRTADRADRQLHANRHGVHRPGRRRQPRRIRPHTPRNRHSERRADRSPHLPPLRRRPERPRPVRPRQVQRMAHRRQGRLYRQPALRPVRRLGIGRGRDLRRRLHARRRRQAVRQRRALNPRARQARAPNRHKDRRRRRPVRHNHRPQSRPRPIPPLP